MEVDQRVVDQVRVARGDELAVGDDDVELEVGLAQEGGEVGDGQGRDIPLAGVLKLGDVEGASLGDFAGNFGDVARGQLIGG